MHGPYRRSAPGLPSRQVCCNLLQRSESTGASACRRSLGTTEESATHHHCCRSQHLAYQEAITGAVVGIGTLHTTRSTALGGPARSRQSAWRCLSTRWRARLINARAHDSPPRRRGRRRVLWRRRAVSDSARGVGDARALLLAALGGKADGASGAAVPLVVARGVDDACALYYSRVALPYEGKSRSRWRRCALRFALSSARSAAQVALPYYMWWCARRR